MAALSWHLTNKGRLWDGVLVSCVLCVHGEEVLVSVVHRESRKVEGLAPPRNTTKQRKPTINSNDVQPEKLPDHAPCTIEKAAHDLKCITPTITATGTLHAISTASPSQHHTAQQVHRQSALSHRNPVHVEGGPSRTTTQTAPAPAGTAPRSRGARYQEELMDSHGHTASLRGGVGARGEGRQGDEGGERGIVAARATPLPPPANAALAATIPRSRWIRDT